MKFDEKSSYEIDEVVNICFIFHFHQPYWQPYKIWRRIYSKSYQPWFNLLSEMIANPHFYINIHFSGPFLIRVYQNNRNHIETIKKLINNPQINLIAGFVDEAFVQLSSRPDDILFQLKSYLDLFRKIFKVNPKELFGIHVVERELSARLAQKIAHASKFLDLTPLIYLDAETYFESYAVKPGDSMDLYYKYFNIRDPVHRTVIPFIPNEGLNFIFKDEIEGMPIYTIPMHSKYRYYLLKRKKRNQNDISITPLDYLNLILNEKKKILKYSKKLGNNIKPIILIFSDAERLGQWSGEPKEDLIWLKDLFKLIIKNKSLNLTTLRSYFHEQGFLDTYPIKISNSYPEFKNWSANRGIRGLIFSDPKLRKVYCQTLYLENLQNRIDTLFIKKLKKEFSYSSKVKDIGVNIFSNLLYSPDRFYLIKEIAKTFENPIVSKLYHVINRLRNMSYIEDGKWATRHPNFGNQPHLDSMALSFLDIAEFLCFRMLDHLNQNHCFDMIKLIDWNKNGLKEILLQNIFQKVIISLKGSHIIFHQIRSTKLIKSNDNEILSLLSPIINYKQIDRSTENLSTNICFTEPDSELETNFGDHGSRKEKCRNSFRINILIEENGISTYLGNFSDSLFIIDKKDNLSINLKCKKNFKYKNKNFNFLLKKHFYLDKSELNIDLEVELLNNDNIQENIIIIPELVFTLLPSNGLDFTPEYYIDFRLFNISNYKTLYEIETSCLELIDNKLKFKKSIIKNIRMEPCKSIFIMPKIVESNNKIRNPKISINLKEDCINSLKKIEISPAIKHFYRSVFLNENSLLNYHTGGIKIQPHLILSKSNNQKFGFNINYDLDENFNRTCGNPQSISLLNIKKVKNPK